MELTPAGELIVAVAFFIVVVLWLMAIGTALFNDRLDGPSPW